MSTTACSETVTAQGLHNSTALVYLVACTLDGYIAGVDGSVEFFPIEDPHIANLIAEFPEVFPGHLREPLNVTADNQRFDTVLMGRATYEIGQAVGITSPYPHLRQILVSSSTSSLPDPAVEVVADDAVARIRALKANLARTSGCAAADNLPPPW